MMKTNFFNAKALTLIAGPCVIESEQMLLSHARNLKRIAAELGVRFVFKASFDKANRSSLKSYRGPGLLEGLKMLAEVKTRFGLAVLTDVHSVEQVKSIAAVCDIIQIPALLCRQTDLLLAVAETGKTVNLKKGQFMAPWDMREAVKKIESRGNKNIILTERGTSFGYNNLVSDFRSLSIMRSFGYPVVFDATHSVQLPGSSGSCSGGEREFAALLSRAAVAAGCDGLFLEVHQNPAKALCDGPNMVDFKELKKILSQAVKIKRIVR